MTDKTSIPPLRDLPPRHLEARKQHLLAEITREPRSRLRASIRWTPLRLAGVAGAAAAAAIAVALVSTTGGGVSTSGRTSAAPIAPLYAFHASLASRVKGNHSYAVTYRASVLDAERAARTQGVPLPVFVLARRQAASNGDPHPTRADWLKTTRQQAVSSQSSDRVDSGGRPVYFVVLHGHFVDENAYYLGRGKKGSSANAPHGTVLSFTIDVKSGDVLDFALGNSSPNYSKIGTPHRFTLGGHGRSR